MPSNHNKLYHKENYPDFSGFQLLKNISIQKVIKIAKFEIK